METVLPVWVLRPSAKQADGSVDGVGRSSSVIAFEAGDWET